MIKEIAYSSYAANPSDYESPDGQLAYSLDVVMEDGSLKPVPQPKIVHTLSEDVSSMFIHKTISFTHYILFNSKDNTLSWTDGTFKEPTLIGTYKGISAIKSVGNVLILAFSDKAITYIYWKEDKYIDLGSPGAIKIIINQSTTLSSSSMFEQSEGDYYTFNDYIDIDKFKTAVNDKNAKLYIDDDNKPKVCNKIFALLDQMIAESSKKGVFNYPFFIRFAYRMYDGTTRIMFTEPYLVIPTSTGKPLLLLNVSGDKIRPSFFLPEMSISFQCKPVSEKWKDIITHIDVLATPQMYGYISDDKGVKEISHVDSEEYDAFTSGFAKAGGLTRDYRPKITDMVGDGFYNINQVNINTLKKWYGYVDSNAAYAWINLKGEPSDNFKVETLVEAMGSPAKYTELPTVSVSDAKSLGLPVSDGFKIYKVDKATAQSTAGVSSWDGTCSIYILRKGSISGDPVYYSTDKTDIDYNNCLSVKLTRESEDSNPNDIRTLNDMVVGDNPYYLLYSIEYDKLISNNDDYIEIIPNLTGSLIKNIAVKENVPDDYRSGDGIASDMLFAYNSRINAAAKRIFPYPGDYLAGYFGYPRADQSGQNDIPTDIANYITDIYFEIYENYTTYVTHVQEETSSMYETGCQFGFLNWIYYPNINAKRAYFKDTNGNIFAVDLKKHFHLNGCYAFNNFQPIAYIANKVDAVPAGSGYIPTDKLYTSEVNNPFYFPLSGINTVGTGDIIGLSSAVKAMSEGQFGQFPLYVFTTEGVWAMTVNSDGTYSSAQPVSRDVCDNPDSITQIDTAVLFCTDRGIMMVSGSETACISDILDSEDPFMISQLPKYDQLVSAYNDGASSDKKFNTLTADVLPFRKFLSGCGMIYDYTHQHIIVYNPAVRYAYVYSLKSKAWGMMHSDIFSTVNSYPQAMAITISKSPVVSPASEIGTTTNIRNLVDFSQTDDTSVRAFVITRPLKISPDVLKTIDTVIQRGYFQNGNISQVLYGSRDLFNWHIVWSSKDRYLRGFRGTPYKYFRLAFIAGLDIKERVSGCTIQFYPRFTNKPR